MRKRRKVETVRKYQKTQVKEEDLQAILGTTTYAPTGAGQQSPVIVFDQNLELLQKISKMNVAVAGANADPFRGTPTVAMPRLIKQLLRAGKKMLRW